MREGRWGTRQRGRCLKAKAKKKRASVTRRIQAEAWQSRSCIWLTWIGGPTSFLCLSFQLCEWTTWLQCPDKRCNCVFGLRNGCLGVNWVRDNCSTSCLDECTHGKRLFHYEEKYEHFNSWGRRMSRVQKTVAKCQIMWYQKEPTPDFCSWN